MWARKTLRVATTWWHSPRSGGFFWTLMSVIASCTCAIGAVTYRSIPIRHAVAHIRIPYWGHVIYFVLVGGTILSVRLLSTDWAALAIIRGSFSFDSESPV